MTTKISDLQREVAERIKSAKEFATKSDWKDEDQVELDSRLAGVESLKKRVASIKSLRKAEAEDAVPVDDEDKDEDEDEDKDAEDEDEDEGSKKSYRAQTVRKNYADIKAKHAPRYAEPKRNSAPQQKGFGYVQFLMGMSKSNNPVTAAEFVEERFKNTRVAGEVYKSLNTSTGLSSGGVLIPNMLSNELIELLRVAVAVERLGPTQVGLEQGNLRMPRLATTVSSTWQGENVDITSSQPSLDYIDLSAKKLTTNVPVSNDLIRRAPIGVEQMVLDDMIASIARKLDIAYIRGAGNAQDPTGLLNQAGISKSDVTSNAGTLDDVVSVLRGMIAQLQRGNSRMLRPGYIMHSDVVNFIASLRDGVGGWFAYKNELDAGQLHGIPFATSNAIPTNLANVGGASRTNGTEIYLADFADVLIGNTMNVQVESSREAAYNEGGALTSAWARDTTAFRVITEVDLAVRHPESVAVRRVDGWKN